MTTPNVEGIQRLREAWYTYSDKAAPPDGHTAACRRYYARPGFRHPMHVCTCGLRELELAIVELVSPFSEGQRK